jgi:hypothetical protein
MEETAYSYRELNKQTGRIEKGHFSACGLDMGLQPSVERRNITKASNLFRFFDANYVMEKRNYLR